MSEAINQVLIDSAAKGDVAAMVDALTAGADPNARIVVDEEGGLTSALLAAVTARSRDAVVLLLSRGADPNDFRGAVMATAVMRREIEICRLLLAAGARPEMEEGNDHFVETALGNRDFETIRLLLEAGAPMLRAPHLRHRLRKLAEAAGYTDVANRALEAS